jgi:ssDNA-binding Zn-finger/Zn-ribbon topoisomerase 1
MATEYCCPECGTLNFVRDYAAVLEKAKKGECILGCSNALKCAHTWKPDDQETIVKILQKRVDEVGGVGEPFALRT